MQTYRFFTRRSYFHEKLEKDLLQISVYKPESINYKLPHM